MNHIALFQGDGLRARNIMFRRLRAFAIIALIGFFAGDVCAQAHGVKSRALYGKPAQLKLDKTIKRRFAEYYGAAEWMSLLVEKFHPIGWSKDGKFAYLLEPADEACGCYFAKVVIQDLRSDKILWQYDYEGDSEKTESINTFWRAHAKMISEKLSAHDIVAVRRFAFSGTRINFSGDLLIPKLKIKKDKESNAFGQISNVTLELRSQRKGTKTVYEKHYPLDDYGALLDAEVLGFLQSPFEARGALIVIEVQRGWEGPPHITLTRVAGTSLLTGFQ